MSSSSAAGPWAERSVCACLLLTAVIHLLPLAGLGGAAVLSELYGLAPLDASTELLMQHRAMMFGLLGAGLLAALWLRHWRLPMLLLVLLSDVGFLLLVGLAWPIADELLKIAMADLLSIAALLLALQLERSRR